MNQHIFRKTKVLNFNTFTGNCEITRRLRSLSKVTNYELSRTHSYKKSTYRFLATFLKIAAIVNVLTWYSISPGRYYSLLQAFFLRNNFSHNILSHLSYEIQYQNSLIFTELEKRERKKNRVSQFLWDHTSDLNNVILNVLHK